jgi:hypothetical protein
VLFQGVVPCDFAVRQKDTSNRDFATGGDKLNSALDHLVMQFTKAHDNRIDDDSVDELLISRSCFPRSGSRVVGQATGSVKSPGRRFNRHVGVPVAVHT